MSLEFDLAFLLPFALALLATGAAAGTLAGLLGVGGGIVIVPILYVLLQGMREWIKGIGKKSEPSEAA